MHAPLARIFAVTESPPSTVHRRAIRSYVIRAGRMTAGQEHAWQTLWPRYGIEFTGQPLDLDRIFARTAPRILEIGFGTGDALLAYADRHPESDCLGIEVHPPGVGHLLRQIQQSGLTNVRAICHDAVEVLQYGLPDRCLDEVHIFFPDPWHKKRHHKRRLLQPPFVSLLANVLKQAGILRLATDWQDYAQQMLEVMQSSTAFDSLSDASGFVARPEHRPITRFERRGHRLGHGVWDLAYRKKT